LAQGIITDGGVLLGALYVARQITTGQKDVGAFVAYVAYMTQLLNRIYQLVWYQDYFSRLMVATDKLMDILDEESDIIDKGEAVELYQCRGEIEFENVHFLYEDPVWTTAPLLPMTSS
jgi:ATP-binding cassette subfamily B (MDR/TAP) protein 6